MRESSRSSKDGAAVARSMRVTHKEKEASGSSQVAAALVNPEQTRKGVSRKWVILMFMLSSSGVQGPSPPPWGFL